MKRVVPVAAVMVVVAQLLLGCGATSRTASDAVREPFPQVGLSSEHWAAVLSDVAQRCPGDTRVVYVNVEAGPAMEVATCPLRGEAMSQVEVHRYAHSNGQWSLVSERNKRVVAHGCPVHVAELARWFANLPESIFPENAEFLRLFFAGYHDSMTIHTGSQWSSLGGKGMSYVINTCGDIWKCVTTREWIS